MGIEFDIATVLKLIKVFPAPFRQLKYKKYFNCQAEWLFFSQDSLGGLIIN